MIEKREETFNNNAKFAISAYRVRASARSRHFPPTKPARPFYRSSAKLFSTIGETNNRTKSYSTVRDDIERVVLCIRTYLTQEMLQWEYPCCLGWCVYSIWERRAKTLHYQSSWWINTMLYSSTLVQLANFSHSFRFTFSRNTLTSIKTGKTIFIVLSAVFHFIRDSNTNFQ